MKSSMRAGVCGTSDEQARIDLVGAEAIEEVNSWNLPKWPEPATSRYMEKARAWGHPDPADALLLLEEWTGAEEGSAARWLAAPPVQAVIARGELLYWPAGPLGVFLNIYLYAVYIAEEAGSTAESVRLEVEDYARSQEALPPYVSHRLGLTWYRRGDA